MKRLILLITCCFSLSAFAASPGFDSFNVNQFDVTGKRVALKDGLQVTNLVLFGSSSNLFEVWDTNNVLWFYITPTGITKSGNDTAGQFVLGNNNEYTSLSYSTNLAALGERVLQGAIPWSSDLYQYVDGTNVFQVFRFGASGVDFTFAQMDPHQDYGGTPYIFNTSKPIPSGNLLEAQNQGTNKFVVDWQGNITAPGDLSIDDISADNIQATTILIGGNSVSTFAGITNVMTWALSDMTTALTTGTNKNYWYAPAAGMTIKFVRATLATASSSGTPTFDINEAGTSILSTKITIDANEWDSFTAATPPVISDSAIAANAKIDFDIDVAGTAAAGAQIQIGFTVP